MNIGGFTATSIWNAAVRTLTGFGAGALAVNQGLNQTIAATSVVAFNPVAGRASIFSILLKAGAAATFTIEYTDGTNVWVVSTVAINTTGGQDFSISTLTAFWQLRNTSAGAGNYAFGGAQFVQ